MVEIKKRCLYVLIIQRLKLLYICYSRIIKVFAEEVYRNLNELLPAISEKNMPYIIIQNLQISRASINLAGIIQFPDNLNPNNDNLLRGFAEVFHRILRPFKILLQSE